MATTQTIQIQDNEKNIYYPQTQADAVLRGGQPVAGEILFDCTCVYNSGTKVFTLTPKDDVEEMPDIFTARFLTTAAFPEGGTFQVLGETFTPKLESSDDPVPEGAFLAGRVITLNFQRGGGSDLTGTAFFKAAAVSVPGLFGDGSDGDLVIHNGETVSLPVPVPHQSVVEMQYSSILIEAGGTLTCAEPNAGLVLRCKGDCTIQGTIDQSGKAPKTNPNNAYDYPEELVCGNGGKGGDAGGSAPSNGGRTGGAGMTARPYGGGYSGGGAGGRGHQNYGGYGGSVADLTVDVPDSSLFKGGAGGRSGAAGNGSYGGGGGAGGNGNSSGGGATNTGPAGGTGPGANGGGALTNTGNSGGAGNIGGGVVLLYVGGNLSLEGTINCNGGNGGNAGSERANLSEYCGGGGGGAGGGAIYVVHNGTISNTASLQVNGGAAGTKGTSGGNAGVAGSIGSVTIKQYEQGMTK